MRRFRAVVGVLLAAIATFLVSCSSGPAAVAPTYTPEKIAQLQNYVGRVETSRQRLPELLRYIEKDDWINVDNFTHGPLGQIRTHLLRLSGQLLPVDQPRAKAMSEEILGHLQNLDEASQNRNYGEALTQYREFKSDLDAYFDILPEGALKVDEPEVVQEIKSESKSAFDGLRDAVEDAVDDVREAADDVSDDFRDALDGAADSLND